MKNISINRLKQLACVLALAVTAGAACAADIAGNWTWTTPGRNGGPDHVFTLTLKADGPALTGKLSTTGRAGKVIDTQIADGKLDGTTLTFNVVHENKGKATTNSYTGTLADDQIIGKIGFDHDGKVQSHDWTAKRAVEAK